MIHLGDCREVLAGMAADSADSCVTDPPYGLGFMGKGWDHGVPGVEFWAEVLRVLKPGAHLLAFGGTRTFHRLTVAIEDAGFEIRDCLMWVYGSGFPKSLDISKALDKMAGHWRGRCGEVTIEDQASKGTGYERTDKGEPVTPEAQQWDGWGTALKPAWEPCIMARKPLVGTVARNVLAYGTGGINVGACRVGDDVTGWGGGGSALYDGGLSREGGDARPVAGRWPANLIHDGSPEVLAGFPESAARFFYCAKASRAEREAGLEALTAAHVDPSRQEGTPGRESPRAGAGRSGKRANTHPTVKPIALMRYLVRLVTPPGGVVLDPFCGSGSTLCAAVLEGFEPLGIDITPEYIEIARARLAHYSPEPHRPTARDAQGSLWT